MPDDKSNHDKCGNYSPPPEIEDAHWAYEDLQTMLKPNQKTWHRFDPITRERLDQVRQFLWNYVGLDSTVHGGGTAGSTWKAASEQTAHALGKGDYLARNLRKWGHAFIINREDIPTNQIGQGNESMLKDEALVQDIKSPLKLLGKYATAMDVVRFLDTPEMKRRLDRQTSIHLTTAQLWMSKMGYRWANIPKGQYVDGHEREDVVSYQQNKFLPKLAEFEANARIWTEDNIESSNVATAPNIRHTVVWYHDESVFYANDRRIIAWVDENQTAVP